MTKRTFGRGDRRIAAVCAVASILALLVSWPFAPTPFNDDWSYSFIVRHLLRTGHLTYNGWDSAVMLPHIYWGWLWARLLGFSFDVLRLSTFPMAAGSVALVYLLARRCGLVRVYAVFAAMLLGLSPMFMPLAASFMTDVPGEFFVLLSLYAIILSAESDRDSAAMGWMVFGLVAGMIGGASRQVVWIVPLLGLPYLAWFRKTDRRFVAMAAIGWCLLLGVMLWLMHWFARQPLVLPEPSIFKSVLFPHRGFSVFGEDVLRLVLTVVLLVLPATECIIQRWRGWVSVLAILLFTGCIVMLRHRPPWAVEPWMPNTLGASGILGWVEMGGGSPDKMLRDPVRWLLSAAVFAVVAFLISAMIFNVGYFRKLLFDPRSRERQAGNRPPFGHAIALLILFGAAYAALLLPRLAQGNAFDRYALPLIPCLAIPMLLESQKYRKAPSILAWIALSIYGVYGICSTQELMALGRARAIAANRLMAAGIARTEIGGGFEFDNWTELETTGHVNSSRIANPPGIFRPGLGLSPSVQPVYRLEFEPTKLTVPSKYGTVGYTTYWMPFHRKVWIDRVIAKTGE